MILRKQKRHPQQIHDFARLAQLAGLVAVDHLLRRHLAPIPRPTLQNRDDLLNRENAIFRCEAHQVWLTGPSMIRG